MKLLFSIWWAMTGSNRRPSRCKRGILLGFLRISRDFSAQTATNYQRLTQTTSGLRKSGFLATKNLRKFCELFCQKFDLISSAGSFSDALAPESDDNPYKSTPLSTILSNHALAFLRVTGRELKVCPRVVGV